MVECFLVVGNHLIWYNATLSYGQLRKIASLDKPTRFSLLQVWD